MRPSTTFNYLILLKEKTKETGMPLAFTQVERVRHPN
jgi:hypothetical protein